jgi:hypothetical protein
VACCETKHSVSQSRRPQASLGTVGFSDSWACWHDPWPSPAWLAIASTTSASFSVFCVAGPRATDRLAQLSQQAMPVCVPHQACELRAKIPRGVSPGEARRRAGRRGCVRTDDAARMRVKVRVKVRVKAKTKAKAKAVLVILADTAHRWLRGQRVCVCPWLSAHALEKSSRGESQVKVPKY